jgi:poly(3-hydroxybutyrate) depolymerase
MWQQSVVIVAMVFALGPSAAAAQTRETGFLNRTATVAGEAYRFQVFVPADYTPTRAWPVVLFLHGGGERGTDGIFQTEVGIGSAVRRFADRFAAIVVMPQARPATWPSRRSVRPSPSSRPIPPAST